jgi:glycyl-tRNA synthetase beta chain
MNELLFEIGCEEIPARLVAETLTYLQQRAAALADELPVGDVKTFGSPRRLTLSVTGIADATKRTKKELLGPSVKAAFDAEGKPTRAAEGFAKTTGIAADKLARKVTPKGEYLFAEVEEGGEAVKAVLERFLADVLVKIPFPKSMRWGSEDVRFSRPVQWLLAVLKTAKGSETLALSFGSLAAGNVSRGHRFMANETFQASSREDYVTKLRERFVIADPIERKERVLQEARRAAKDAGGFLYQDSEGGAHFQPDPLAQQTYFDGLLDEITFLCETPFGVYGTFDEKALELPREVILAAMRNHQRYFAVCDKDGQLKNAFVTIAASRVKDPALVRRGNERVLKARLADATYFFVEDQKRPLASRIDDLKTVTYHKKIGSSFDKVQRVEKLALAIAKALSKDLPNLSRAAQLAKADLTTLMVGEFPELQGTVGAHYAKIAGEQADVVSAISDHYRPRSADDAPASGDLSAVLAIADKLDTIVGIVAIGQLPTGSSDPFALRRAAIGVLRTIFERAYSLDLRALTEVALKGFEGSQMKAQPGTTDKVLAFLTDRFLNYSLPEKPGPKADVVRAVVAAGAENPLEAKNRISALEQFLEAGSLTELVAVVKRAANILKEPVTGDVEPGLLTHASEKDLFSAVQTISDAWTKLEEKSAKSYLGYLQTMTGSTAGAPLQARLAGFFDGVMVMDKDEAVKNNRLRLLDRVVKLTGYIADFSKL